MSMKTITFFVLCALSGVVSALPADPALAQGGYTAYDAIPGRDGLAARTHEGKIDGKDLFASCPGGPGSPHVSRADRCTLINIKNNADKRVWKVLGDPQLNCKGSTEPITVSLGGETTVSQTTEINANFGIAAEGLSIGGGISESLGTSTTQSKTISFNIPPGRQAVYVVGVNHKSQTGNVQVNYGSRQMGHFVWFTGATITRLTPVHDDVQFDVFQSPCGTNPEDLRSFNGRQ
ncbi:hypothetical protein C8Q80DRAFT_1356330 [Daedaleopsis nitida]|nr:hypothetical protein C8Q80DRAFT_1356330 [Daedaleopsis nitida]